MTSVNQRPNSLLIRGGRVIDPSQALDVEADVLLKDGRVVEVGKVSGSADETIDAKGMVVAPGLIDIHVHLREPGQWQKETIASGTAAAAAGGFTSVCSMPNTSPVNDIPAITRWILAPERGAVVNVFPVAAATVGSLGEKITNHFALAMAGAVGVTDDGKPILSDRIMREVLVAATEAGLPVLQHAEDTTLTEGATMHEGPTAFRLGLRGMPAAAESRIVERDIDLAAEVGARLHVMHISTAAALEAVRRGKTAGVQVTCEAAPHHFTLTDEDIGDYDTHRKMNPPLRSREDREAILQGLADGTIDCIATDHAPHAPHEKAVEFDRAPFGIVGLETALGLTISKLHAERKLPLMRIIELLSTNPARVMGLEDRGSLKAGFVADVTIFDSNRKWSFDIRESRSKSRNTPFTGWQLQGKAVATIVGGRIAYRAE